MHKRHDHTYTWPIQQKYGACHPQWMTALTQIHHKLINFEICLQNNFFCARLDQPSNMISISHAPSENYTGIFQFWEQLKIWTFLLVADHFDFCFSPFKIAGCEFFEHSKNRFMCKIADFSTNMPKSLTYACIQIDLPIFISLKRRKQNE